MEPYFGFDFGSVRIHTDGVAGESARKLGVLAYASGRDVYFANGQYDPDSFRGKQILAHELMHVVQQGGKRANGELRYGASERHERQARNAAVSMALGSGTSPAAEKTGTAVMALTPDEFKAQLSITEDHKKAINALFGNAYFVSLWSYMEKCPMTPKKDLGPLGLLAVPHLFVGGAERYGGYAKSARSIVINAGKQEHIDNPAEVIDTMTHEMIHAVFDLGPGCMAAGAKEPPLAGAATIKKRTMAEVGGTPEEDKLMADQGPKASHPCGEFEDVNATAQQLIIQVLKGTMKQSKVGSPTVTYLNEILRRDTKAMGEYKDCRKKACAIADRPAMDTAISACTSAIITKYMPNDLKP